MKDNESKKFEFEMLRTLDSDGVDGPALIFYFEVAQDVHSCVGLPSISDVDSPLQQGNKKIIMPFCYYPHFVGGTLLLQNNSFKWLDMVTTRLNLTSSFSRVIRRQRLQGVFDHLKHEHLTMF